MLEIKNMNISIDDRYLVQNLNLVLNKGDKLAIIGEEGNGKSTLLKAILGKCEYAVCDGYINFKGNTIGYLEQSLGSENFHLTVHEFLFKDESDYYSKLASLYGHLEKLHLTDEILEKEVGYLSGGEKVKIGILKLLLAEDDILFLDEPTNDLDIKTLEWLEEFIAEVDKPVVYVSHDETLLSNTANMILHLEKTEKKTSCRHTLLKIDYDTYVEQRMRKIAKQCQVAKSERREFKKRQEKLQQVMQKVEYRQNTISRSDPHGAKLLKKKIHSLKSQERKLEATELTEIPDIEDSIDIFFESVEIPKTKIVLNLHLEQLSIDDKLLARNVKLDIVGNVHICIVGDNGVGKSTLIKRIYDELKSRPDLKVGYMPQNYDEILGDYENVLDFISPSSNKDEITKSRTMLGNMNFTKSEMTGRIANLSNGSKAKLLLAKLILDQSNVLILDEPTRNVSPLSNPIIRKALREYGGTIISVSHDRKYIEEVIDDIYILNVDGLIKHN